MKRLVGGLVLLNLATIALNLSAGEQSITDPDVLKQLEDLRIFIDEKRDFSKQSSKGLKPVLVQYRSNNGKFDGIVACNLSFNTDALHLSIGGTSVQADGTPITIIINVVYEYTEYVGYTIKTAKINATDTALFKDISIDGDVEIDGDVSVDETSNVKVFENIVDKDGHKRFIEGDILFNNPNLTMFTKYYGKWSLSGTHLTFVVAGKIDATYTSNVLSEVTIPEWIWNKIFPVGESIYIENKLIKIYSDDFTTSQEVSVSLRKRTSTGLIDIVFSGATIEVDRYFRAQFDLLIDNEDAE